MTNHCELFNFVTCCVVIGTLCVFGLVGNATAIWVFKMHRTVTSTISILLVLAVGDSLLLATTLPKPKVRNPARPNRRHRLVANAVQKRLPYISKRAVCVLNP